MEVGDTVQEKGSRPSPRKRNAKKQNGCLGKALQIAVKRREVKSKGEKERYKHLNAEFQRRARRDKKAFLSNQCKEIEQNNRDQDHPHGKEMQKAKWLSGEALQIAVKRREAKSKGEKE